MSAVTKQPQPTEPVVIEQRLLLHDICAPEHAAIIEVLRDRPSLRFSYDGQNLQIYTIPSLPAPNLWTSDVQRLLLRDLNWGQYDKLLVALDRHHLRTTYDRGNLELMTLSPEHEEYKNALRLLIQVLAEQFKVAVKNIGSTTCRRQDLDRGLEPDECYYIQNWPVVRGMQRLDLSVHPPPDLAVEVDVTSSSQDRMGTYANLGIQEVWRFDGDSLQAHVLGVDGSYADVSRSPTFPAVALGEAASLVRASVNDDDSTILNSCRAWVREQLAKNA